MVNEQDVVIAFRQAIEEELRRAQENNEPHDSLLQEGLSTEELVHRLVSRHEELEHEVKLLRTIILKLISEPVDEQQ